jgi:hypothetical protein
MEHSLVTNGSGVPSHVSSSAKPMKAGCNSALQPTNVVALVNRGGTQREMTLQLVAMQESAIVQGYSAAVMLSSKLKASVVCV